MEPQIYTDTASTTQIIDWATDEFNKMKVDNFPLVIADEKLLEERSKLYRYRFKRKYMYQFINRIPKWLRFKRLVNAFYVIAEKEADKFLNGVVAETCNQETDFQDSIILYPEHFYTYVKMFESRIVPFEVLVRDIIRHESRHTKQILEMRRVGINPSIAFSFEAIQYKYGKGPLEEDAVEFQLGNDVAPIKEVIEIYKKKMEKKGWL